jgi:hypothetical protein
LTPAIKLADRPERAYHPLPVNNTRSIIMTRELDAANELRRIADLVQRGKHVAVAYILVDEDGDSECGGVVDEKYQTKEIFDKMVYELKIVLFESLEGV